jgi:hypothetical protein
MALFFREIGGVEVWKKETRKTRSMRVEKILKKISEGPALSVRGLFGGVVLALWSECAPWGFFGRAEPIPPMIFWTDGAGPSGLPGQFVDFALEGPLIGFLTMSMAHGVVADIVPFLVVALAAAEFSIPKMALPEAHFTPCDLMPLSAYRAFPIGDPVLQWRLVFQSLCAKEMHVVG